MEVADVPAVLAPGTTCILGVTVVNCSEVEWEQDQSNVLNVGNHWRSLDGAHVDASTPRRVAPHPERGSTLEQEHVSWFEVRGAEVAIRSVQVVEEMDAAARRLPAKEALPACPWTTRCS